jgi:hypothetical protein
MTIKAQNIRTGATILTRPSGLAPLASYDVLSAQVNGQNVMVRLIAQVPFTVKYDLDELVAVP